MATLEFKVGRKNAESIDCVAQIPPLKELLAKPTETFNCTITGPDGAVVRTGVKSLRDLVLDQLTIVLQHACRDEFLPKDDEPKSTSKRGKTRYSE